MPPVSLPLCIQFLIQQVNAPLTEAPDSPGVWDPNLRVQGMGGAEGLKVRPAPALASDIPTPRQTAGVSPRAPSPASVLKFQVTFPDRDICLSGQMKGDSDLWAQTLGVQLAPPDCVSSPW